MRGYAASTGNSLSAKKRKRNKIMKNRSKILIGILPVLACFAFLPGAQAVSPAPDGCYSNFTTAEGCDALKFLDTGIGNTGLGWEALLSTDNSSFNTAVGGGALLSNKADSNTAVGAAALLLNTTGTQNVAVGTDATVFNDSGSFNNAVGAFALFNNDSGGHGAANFNNALGRGALQANVDGTQNDAFGDLALTANLASNNTEMGDEALFNNSDNTCWIGSIDGRPTSDAGSTVAVMIDSNNVLGTISSSRRYKHDIRAMDKASEVILALKPVSFKYNHDVKGTPCFGLIAEDVAVVDPDLVVRSKTGVETVRYEQINAMLLNEFLKEHKKVEQKQASISELKSTVAQQQTGIEVLTAQLKEQAAQIQKVSAQLEVNKPAPQVVVNKP